MPLFPESILISYPVVIGAEWRTLVSDYDSGAEQRRQKWAFPKKRAKIASKNVKPAELGDLWEFYMARKGAKEAFHIYAGNNQDEWYGEHLGTGDDVQDTFDLPGKNVNQATVVVYVNGTSVSYSFSQGTGQWGADQVIISAGAPDSGEIITADFNGLYRLYGRFAADRLSRELFTFLLYNVGVEIQGLKL